MLTSKIPINQRPYKVSQKTLDYTRVQTDKMLAQGIIRPSTSPYSFPVVLVGKKDEAGKTRFCVNYQRLNAITVSESFPMPRIEDIQPIGKFLISRKTCQKNYQNKQQNH